MITTFNTDISFWELYPEFKIALSFKQIYKSDKSRNKESSSKLMWFVAFTTDLNSRYYNLPEEERYAVIGGDYMDSEDYYQKNKDKIDLLINDYIKLQFSAAQRQLMEWDRKSDERAEFISKTKYDLTTYEDLDKMAVNTAKIYDIFKKIKEDLSKEEGDGVAKGGQVPSLND